MLARFLTSSALAVAVAAVFAGGETAAQAPPGQQPAAAAAEKQAKVPKEWPPDAAALAKRRAEAEALPLFASFDPVEIVLTADWKAVQRDRDVESKKLYPGTLAIVAGGVAGTPIPIELRTRGHVRRNVRLCGFAPLRLELPKDRVKGTVFEGQGNLKLGVHCQNADLYEQYVLKEYLANRVLNLLTPMSLRVRLARVTYTDTDAGKKPYTRLGIFYEDADDLAKRVDARELPVPRQMFQYLDQPSLLFMSLFQYMIGNVDYSILALHNVIMLDSVKGARMPVPYDFDYSGLVDAHYAIPAKALPISSVRERLYRGPCKSEAEVEEALKPFREKQAEILALPATLTALGLEDGPRKNAEKYLNEFFDLISKPDKVKKTFVTDCKPIPGM
ncbi:MAG: hypothetical protein ACM3H9_04950 [Rhodospirillaceae bacterium]